MLTINNKTYSVETIRLDTQDPTGMAVNIDFAVTDNQVDFVTHYGVMLHGEKAQTFYNDWYTDADVYEALVENLGANVEVPEDTIL